MSVVDKTLNIELGNIAHKISELVPDSQTILSGSYARGEQADGSDLDLCVLVPKIEGRHMDMRLKVRAVIRDATALPLDVIVYTFDEFEYSSKFPSRLPYSIKAEGVVLNA